jgi:hypothetical protein
MNRKTQLLGYLSSWGIIILMLLSFIGIFLPLVIHKDNGWAPAKTSFYTIDTPDDFLSYLFGFLYFLHTPLMLILFACFHDYASTTVKIFSGIALSFIITYVVLNSWSFIAQNAISRFNIHACNDDCLIYFTHSLFEDIITSVHIMAITTLMGLAELFLIPVFSKANKIGKKIRFTLIISVVINFLTLLMFLLDKEEISAICMLFSHLFFIVVLILCIKFFKRFKFRSMMDSNP